LSPIALLVLAAAACGGGTTTTVTVVHTVTVTSPASTTSADKGATLYFLRGGKVGPVYRLVRGLGRPDLLAALEAGPTERERAIGFTSDMAASPMSKTRLAQIVYTDTQFDPTAQVTVDGKSYTRADFEEQTPAILVENPLPFAHEQNAVRITGTANTFEATFQYELKDAAGQVLAKHFVTATSGNGVRGTFDLSFPFTVTRQQQGTLTVYEDSAATGERINEYAIPLTLTP